MIGWARGYQRAWLRDDLVSGLVDFALAFTALLGVLSTSVIAGLSIAVFLSLVMLLYRASRPYITILGRRPSGEFGDMSRHADGQPVPGLVILRLDAPLYFFNANVAPTQILQAASMVM